MIILKIFLFIENRIYIRYTKYILKNALNIIKNKSVSYPGNANPVAPRRYNIRPFIVLLKYAFCTKGSF
ncbi:hypothetical protein J2128_000439 [Methanomicrobium sp. W14]|nr:hypothetical protein [Methanomicrobium sp. W14]